MKIYQTATYQDWFMRLKDLSGKARIQARLRRCEVAGEVVGDKKYLRDGIWEMRIKTGPGTAFITNRKARRLFYYLLGAIKVAKSEIFCVRCR